MSTLVMDGALVEALLTPIPGASPTGESLRYDASFDAIRDARREDDASLPTGVWQRDLKSSDWERVAGLCSDILTRRSKDLQIAAWQLESWIRLYGFAGARDGLALMLGLCERYWDDVHPRIEDDDPDYRTAPFHWINEKLTAALIAVRISAPHDDDRLRDYTWADWQQALWLEKVRAKAGAKEAPAGSVSYEEFQQSLMATPAPFLRARAEELHAATEAAESLQAYLDERLGSDAPSLVRFRDTLRSIADWTIANLQGRPLDPVAEEVPVTETADDDEEPVAGPAAPLAFLPEQPVLAVSSAALRTREDAFRMLDQIAEYLMKIEPHSPVPYLIKRAIAWGDMTLADLLQEFSQDDLDLHALRVLLGIAERRH